jgi:hypothetical protein
MLGKAGKLRVASGPSKDLGVACSDRAAALALESAGHYSCSAWLGPGTDQFVDERDELVGEANGDLLAHALMVPKWYQSAAPP